MILGAVQFFLRIKQSAWLWKFCPHGQHRLECWIRLSEHWPPHETSFNYRPPKRCPTFDKIVANEKIILCEHWWSQTINKLLNWIRDIGKKLSEEHQQMKSLNIWQPFIESEHLATFILFSLSSASFCKEI